MRLKKIVFATLLAVLILVNSIAIAAETSNPAENLKGIKWVKGEPVDQFEKGKIYVVEFWATWCPPCRVSIPHLTEVQKKYKDKGVTVIGISNETLEKVEPFVKEKGDQMNYTVAIDVNSLANNAYMKKYNQRGIPSAFIVDQKGNIAWVGHPMSNMEEVLDKIIAGEFDSAAYMADKQPVEKVIEKPKEKIIEPVKEKAAEAQKKDSKNYQLEDANELTELKWVKGKPVEKFEEGKVYIVEFWATWCAPCKVSIPHLTEVQKKYKDKGVTVIGISDEAIETVEPFVKEKGDEMNYTVALDVNNLAKIAYMQKYNAQGIPTAFIVDQKGKIAWYGHPMAEMEDILDKVIAGEFDAAAYMAEKQIKDSEQAELLNAFKGYIAALENSDPNNAKKYGDIILSKNDVDLLAGVAWVSSTQIAADKRDIKFALTAAEKAYKLSKGENLNIIRMYARVLYEAGGKGNIQKAIEMQTKLIDWQIANVDPNVLENAKSMFQGELDKYKDALEKIEE